MGALLTTGMERTPASREWNAKWVQENACVLFTTRSGSRNSSRPTDMEDTHASRAWNAKQGPEEQERRHTELGGKRCCKLTGPLSRHCGDTPGRSGNRYICFAVF